MNGAESLVRSLLASSVDTCFANPGTSEMHFVAALDRVDGMRCVLGLAETVVTGCADGYARMSGKPAATLMHCGPGLANGLSNVHNARRAFSPMVNIVGDHATYHRPFDTPLTFDTEGLARTVSHWVKTSVSSQRVGGDGAAAVQAARTYPGQIATLILPADTAWSEGGQSAAPLPVPEAPSVAPETVRSIARALRSGERSVLVLTGEALSEPGLVAAQRVAHVTGAVLRCPTQLPRMARGRGRVPVDRIPYVVDKAIEVLSGVRHVVLVGAKPPTGFFAYPNKPSLLAPPDSITHVLARPEQDLISALDALADELGAPKKVSIPRADSEPQILEGRFEPVAFATTLAALLPENCIVSEDGVTSGRALLAPTFNAAPHDWIQITGGAIGQGFPAATGAAMACPDRKVVCLQADGAGMYTVQALWTQAREKLDVINVVFANRAYKILHGELLAVGAQPGHASGELFDLSRPELDWISLANGMGVEATRVETLEGFADVFKAGSARKGPFLIEFRI
ncbi:MAG: acetolactate synthase large subunit [Betaproteobacteria bacterium]|jgi:acetolactate synthase-1/2/3 large subunit|nr:MAG: acetolactate synthase large subunit [Betaproteobacteria bacterium]